MGRPSSTRENRCFTPSSHTASPEDTRAFQLATELYNYHEMWLLHLQKHLMHENCLPSHKNHHRGAPWPIGASPPHQAHHTSVIPRVCEVGENQRSTSRFNF